jgi:hypothetical protein
MIVYSVTVDSPHSEDDRLHALSQGNNTGTPSAVDHFSIAPDDHALATPPFSP